jgi:hypothetical protein
MDGVYYIDALFSRDLAADQPTPPTRSWIWTTRIAA